MILRRLQSTIKKVAYDPTLNKESKKNKGRYT